MSKNTSSTAYRKVNVDQYDEDNYVEDDNSAQDNASQVATRETEVKKLLSGGKPEEALKVALTDPPLNSKDQALKDKNTNTVLNVLTSIKAADVAKAVNSLSSEQVDVLMKYIYRGMNVDGKSKSDENQSGILLNWHAAAYEAGGHGAIIRVLTDRRTV